MKNWIRALMICAALSSASQATTLTFSAVLNGASEAPPNASAGTGTALVTYDDLTHLLALNVSFSGLTGNVTAAHIHCCTAAAGTGTAGVATVTPTFTGFPTGVTFGTYIHSFDLTQASSWNAAFVTAHGGLALAETDLVAALTAGKAYLNIHSTSFAGGEIRGFLAPVPEPGTAVLAVPLLLGWWLRRKR